MKKLLGAACTTNAITPPLKLIDDAFKIQSGHIETIHAYTNDQNLVDNYTNPIEGAEVQH